MQKKKKKESKVFRLAVNRVVNNVMCESSNVEIKAISFSFSFFDTLIYRYRILQRRMPLLKVIHAQQLFIKTTFIIDSHEYFGIKRNSYLCVYHSHVAFYWLLEEPTYF